MICLPEKFAKWNLGLIDLTLIMVKFALHSSEIHIGLEQR